MYYTGHEEKDAGYYDNIYRRNYNTDGAVLLYREIHGIIKSVPEPRVLEIGCGLGDLAEILIADRIPYRGFDFSEIAIGHCREKCPNGDFFVADAYRPENYLPHDYNTVVAIEVLEHVNDIKLIRNIPVGVRLIASVPNYNDAAHLRLYRNPKNDIIEYFRPYLRVKHIGIAGFEGQSGPSAQMIFLFEGIRINRPISNVPVKTEIVGEPDCD